MRVTPKSAASTSAAPAQSGTAKSAPVSFLDMLSGASADATSAIGISDSKSQGQSGKNSGGGRDSNQSDKPSTDAAQAALLSGLIPVIPTPADANALPVGQSGSIANPGGATKTVEAMSLTSGTVNGSGVFVSTTQIAPSLLADSATVPVRPFQSLAAETNTSSPSTVDPTDSKPQTGAQRPRSQAPSSATDISQAAKAGLQQVMSKGLQVPPQANSQDQKPNSTETAAANQTTANSATNATSALSPDLAAVATNLSSLPPSSGKGNAPSTAVPTSGINGSLRTWNPQSKMSPNATNSAGTPADTKADQANQAATSNGSSHGADNNNQQDQNSQPSTVQAPVPAKTPDAVPSHLIPTAPIAKQGDTSPSGTVTQGSDSGPHHVAESGSVSSDPMAAAASAGASGINAARVIQSMSGTEMRVGMHSSDFGEISIHTTLSQLQLQTQISVNHSELGTAIATHIPTIQAKLGSDHGIHASIEVSQMGSSLSGNPGQSSSQRNQKAFVPTPANINDPTPVDAGYSGLRAPPAAIEESRLDIRA